MALPASVAQGDGGFPPVVAPVVRLSLLDGFELRCDDELVALPLSAQRLVAFLALQRRPKLRSYVAGVLWPDSTEAKAAACLRSALWRLHQTRCPAVVAPARRMALDASVVVDVRVAEARARPLLDGTAPDKGWWSSDLLTGELLPDWYEDWAVVERERLRQLQLHALEVLCERFIDEGRNAQAVEAGQAAVAVEPLRESAHRVLIRSHLAEGNPAEALRQYRSYRSLLGADLGLEPSPRLQDLVAHLHR